jgi:beta-lactamase superfamily II metal-dependent hydrolase
MMKFVKPYCTKLRDENNKPVTELLWGDPVHVLDDSGDRVQVKARGREGFLGREELSDESLLELYIIDVGQGDGVLVKTPDGKWHLIDAGVENARQMTKKGCANFIRWKFRKDLAEDGVSLENVIVTHPDSDHYGGMENVFSGNVGDGDDFTVTVAHFYHNGMARFGESPKLGSGEKGEVPEFPKEGRGISEKGTFIHELLDKKESFSNPGRPFEKSFSGYTGLVASVPVTVNRISNRDGYVPGYGPQENPVTIRVLGPVLEEYAPGKYGLRKFDSDSHTINGHSVVLKIEYGSARILLSGDLHAKAQELLMRYHPASVFMADVFKGCHHGAEDVASGFMQAVCAGATIISSGDDETYSHPRPALMGATGKYSRNITDTEGNEQPPLIYSTELARSVKLAYVNKIRVREGSAGGSPEKEVTPKNAWVRVPEWDGFRSMEKVPVSANLIYGLVNVRTDGTWILCATMREKGVSFDWKVFRAGTSS